ncbi:hypothetical protein HY989_05960 [Candidatus Micrarchaeota archaeon]|nr:hypothetical protein [Candidatus Micrarchaeota archaeon]
MDAVLLILILLAGGGFFLNVSWMFLSAIFLLLAVIASRVYARPTPSEHVPPDMESALPTPQAQKPPQPIIIMQGGGGLSAYETMMANMMGQLMAIDAYEKTDQQKVGTYLSRGGKFRQNFFDHSGKLTLKHQGFNPDRSREESGSLSKRLESIEKKLDKK